MEAVLQDLHQSEPHWQSDLGEFPVILTDALTNITDSIQVISYEFEITASGFTNALSITADVTVNPTPSPDNCEFQWNDQQRYHYRYHAQYAY